MIVYGLETIISFATNHQYIFVAQRVSWLALIIGLEKGLIIHNDNLRSREDKPTQEDLGVLQDTQPDAESV